MSSSSSHMRIGEYTSRDSKKPSGYSASNMIPPSSGRDHFGLKKYEESHQDRYSVKKDERSSGVVKSEYSDSRPVIEKEQPNFELSGLLAEDQNQRNGVALTFTVSPDAAVPDTKLHDWRLFELKGEENTHINKLASYSCFLFGKDRRLEESRAGGEEILFIPVDHPTCSRQHAVIQFRLKRGEAVPYLMDLNSTNKTFLNKRPVEEGRYIELRHQDVIKFGQSSREYVLLDAMHR